MEKKKAFRALARNLPMSPTKIRPIADHIRRKPYIEAVAILEALPQKGARFLLKCVQSAGANAMHHKDTLDEEGLYIKELMIDGGPTQKRIWPRSRGRADRQMKRSSHISVVLGEIEEDR